MFVRQYITGYLSYLITTTECYKFYDLVDKEIKLTIKLNLPNDVDHAVSNLTEVIQSATWSSNSVIKPYSINTNPLPTDIQMFMTVNREQELCQRTFLRPINKYIIIQLTHLKELYLKIKPFCLKIILKNLTKDSSLWKATKQALQYKASLPSIRKSDGSFASFDTDKVELFKTYFNNISASS